MTEREALKMALEALELAGGNLCEALHHPKKLQHGIGEPCPAVAKYDKAITAIKEALAQPEHGWTSERIAGMARLKEAQDKRQEFPKRFDTHPTPPQRTWIGLTPQERDEINQQVYGAVPHHVAFHAAIEQALREKNT